MDITWNYDTELDRHTCTSVHCQVTVYEDGIGRWVGIIHAMNFGSLGDARSWGVVEARRLNANDRRQLVR